MNSRITLTETRLVVAAFLFIASPLLGQTPAPPDEVAEGSLKFTQVFSALQESFMDPVDPDRSIFDGGIRGMLSALDPFSAFFDRDQFELLQQQTRGEALGFGSILYVTPGKVLVLQTAQGSPSWRVGLGPGDEIVEVNGTRINRLDFQSLIELLRRSRSHPVRLGVIRPGRVVAQDFELNPAEVALPTVDRAFLWSPGIGYLHLTSFEQKTPQEVVGALSRLDAAHLKGLFLDLRDNHGGIVDAAVVVASLFLKPDALVLTTRGRSFPEKAYRTVSTPHSFDIPLVVLVNGNTASAAEVLAAALQEHDRAVIAGEPTFGKGVVQSVAELSEKTGLALTTAQYFTSSGRSIQRPLPGTSLVWSEAAHGAETGAARGAGTGDPGTEAAPEFHTDNGRPVEAGGGIAPDVLIPARAIDPWLTFLNQRGTFTNFAADYISVHGKISESFEPPSALLEDFADFLSKNRIRAPEEYWTQDQDYLKLKIKIELFSLVFGLTRGEEIEAQGDPQVQQAARLIPQIPRLLQASKTK